MQRWMYLEVWRWLYFCAGMLPLHYLCTLLVHLLYVAGERQLFTVHHALYFAVSLRVSTQLHSSPFSRQLLSSFCPSLSPRYDPVLVDLKLSPPRFFGAQPTAYPTCLCT